MESSSTQPEEKKLSKYEERQTLVDESIRAKWEIEQNELKTKLREDDLFEWVLDSPDSTKALKLVSSGDSILTVVGGSNRHKLFEE